MRFIRVSPTPDKNSESETAPTLYINTMKVIMVMETHENERGQARIVLDNGKSIYVDESQDEVAELANEHEGSGGGGGGGLLGGKLNL